MKHGQKEMYYFLFRWEVMQTMSVICQREENHFLTVMKTKTNISDMSSENSNSNRVIFLFVKMQF